MKDRPLLGGETPVGDVASGGKMPRREPFRAPLSKRFYAVAGVGSDSAPPFRVLLDGRPVRTPAKAVLALPARALAEAIAAEWSRQASVIDPATMPLTRLANTTIDGVVGKEALLRADIAAFAMSDLLCYRAEVPEELARRQSAAWDPVVRWAEERLDCHFKLAAGVMPVAQAPACRDQTLIALSGRGAFALAALHTITTLTGSALLALAVSERQLDAEAAWSAAHVDEDYQISQWGEDAEASERRAHRYAEMQAAVLFLRASESP